VVFKAEISAALAARYNRNTAVVVSSSGRKRKANPVSPASAAAASPVKSARRESDAVNRRRKQKTSVAAASYQSTTDADDTLYCLCKTPYDESKLVSTSISQFSLKMKFFLNITYHIMSLSHYLFSG